MTQAQTAPDADVLVPWRFECAQSSFRETTIIGTSLGIALAITIIWVLS